MSPLGHVAFKPAAAVDSSGSLWVCWAWWDEGEWDIEGRVWDGSLWRSTPRLVTERGVDLAPSIGVDKRGRVWVAWQSRRSGDFDILAKYWEHGLESETTVVSGGTGWDDYRPALAVGNDGDVWVAWDRWTGKSYQVFASRFDGDSWSSPRDVSSNPGSSSYRPRCAADPSGGIWVAWNVVATGEPRWGTALARVTEHSTEVSLVPPGWVSESTNFATVILDAGDRPWVLWQERQSSRRWYVRASCFDGRRWTVHFPVREQTPREQQFAPSAARSGRGDLWVVWARDGAAAVSIPRETANRLGQEWFCLDPLPWTPKPAPDYGLQPGDASRRTVTVRGKRYGLYWGDLHNHTELSDGRQPLDHLFALCRDCYGEDFVCIADHDNGVTEGEWRFTQAVSGAFYDPGRFVSFSGYESSYKWSSIGAGHRNVCYPRDRGAICHYREGSTLPELLHCVRKDGGIAIPHHIGRSFAPIDWEDFDPTLQPLVEICSIHGVFEYYGNLMKERPDDRPRPMVSRLGEPIESSFVQVGLSRGLRFGVVGSTDSHSSHSFAVRKMGLAAVYAEELTREGIFEALRARRTFGTTGERVFLDFRVNDHFMGEEVVLPRGRNIAVSVAVEAPVEIQRVEVVRNNETVLSRLVASRRVDFTWKDSSPPPEGAYYYARVVLPMNDFAWSSPIWIDWED